MPDTITINTSKHCNLCNGTVWRDAGKRQSVMCAGCGSYERTRAMRIVLEHHNAPAADARVLHLAPEKGLSQWLRERCSGYEAADFDPKLYPHVEARRLDLFADAPALPSNAYDLIIHNHVLEHVPCNLAHVLFHLHRALSPDGLHVFSVPIYGDYYDEYLGPLSEDAATQRFGQFDHVRRFGLNDFDRQLGALLNLKPYSLLDYANEDELDRANIPDAARTGLSGHAIFVARKSDYKLA